MSTSSHDEWFGTLIAEDRTIGLAESRSEVAEAAIGFLTFAGLVLFMVGVSCSFVSGTFYLCSIATDLPFLGQFFGP